MISPVSAWTFTLKGLLPKMNPESFAGSDSNVATHAGYAGPSNGKTLISAR